VEIEAEEFSRQITLLSQALFANITFSELLDKQWNKYDLFFCGV
jgi:hypothetical protein